MKHKKSIQRFLVLSLIVLVGANLQAGIFKKIGSGVKTATSTVAGGVKTATSAVAGGVTDAWDTTTKGVTDAWDTTTKGVKTGVDRTVNIAYGVAGQERPEDKDLEAPGEDEFAWLLEEQAGE